MENVMPDYKAYDCPRKGIFNITTSEYRLPKGWVLKPTEHTIIGETDEHFITRLSTLEYGEWIGEEVVQRSEIVPIGVHKTRFVRWIDTQLVLF